MKISANVKPANKEQAYKYILALGQGQALTECEIQALLLHFAPKPPVIPKSAEVWAAKAVAKKDRRTYLNYLYSDGSNLYGCDGHRLAWVTTTKPKGYYCPKTFLPVPDMDGVNYPDVSRVIPALKDQHYFAVDALEVVVKEGIANHYEIGGQAFNAAYVNDAITGSGKITIQEAAEGSPLRGFCDFGQFVIMPMRIKTNA